MPSFSGKDTVLNIHILRLPLGEVKAMALECFNHLWFSALGMGDRGSVNSLFKLEQFGGVCNLLDRAFGFWVWIAFVGLFTRSAMPTTSSFVSVKRDGFIQTGKWSRLASTHVV